MLINAIISLCKLLYNNNFHNIQLFLKCIQTCHIIIFFTGYNILSMRKRRLRCNYIQESA